MPLRQKRCQPAIHLSNNPKDSPRPFGTRGIFSQSSAVSVPCCAQMRIARRNWAPYRRPLPGPRRRPPKTPPYSGAVLPPYPAAPHWKTQCKRARPPFAPAASAGPVASETNRLRRFPSARSYLRFGQSAPGCPLPPADLFLLQGHLCPMEQHIAGSDCPPQNRVLSIGLLQIPFGYQMVDVASDGLLVNPPHNSVGRQMVQPQTQHPLPLLPRSI